MKTLLFVSLIACLLHNHIHGLLLLRRTYGPYRAAISSTLMARNRDRKTSSSSSSSPSTSSSLQTAQVLSELSDILNKEDSHLINKNIHSLHEIFPHLTAHDLEDVVNRHPILLLLKPKQLKQAVDSICERNPELNPSYLVSQYNSGIELILRNIADNEQPKETDLEIIQTLLGNEIDATKFIKRVPHILVPKYRLVMLEQLKFLTEDLGLTRHEALNLIRRWPVVLYYHLDKVIERTLRVFSFCHINIDKKSLSKMILEEPSLLDRNVGKRIEEIKRTFPTWMIDKVILRFPKILVYHHFDVIVKRYEELSKAVGCDEETNNIINNTPTILRYQPEGLIRKMEAIKLFLPNCTLSSLLTKGGAVMIRPPLRETLSKVKRIQKVFIRAMESPIPDTTSMGNSPVIDDIKTVSDEDIDTSDVLLDVEQIKKESGLTRLQRLYPDLFDLSDNLDSSSSNDLSALERVTLLPSLNTDGWDSSMEDISFSTEPALFVDRSSSDPSDYSGFEESGDSVEDEESTYMKDMMIDVTRIVMANLDIFKEKFTFLTSCIERWINAYDHGVAYVVLSAVPGLARKNPEHYRHSLKMLYGMVAMETAKRESDEQVERRVYLPRRFYHPLTILKRDQAGGASSERSAFLHQLYHLLYRAPKAIQKRPQILRDHIDALQARGITQEVIVFEAPELLHTSIGKIDVANYFFERLLLSSKHFRPTEQFEVNNTELVEVGKAKQIWSYMKTQGISLSELYGPLAVLARAFVYPLLVPSTGDVLPWSLRQILSSNTREFVAHLKEVEIFRKDEGVLRGDVMGNNAVERYLFFLEHLHEQLRAQSSLSSADRSDLEMESVKEAKIVHKGVENEVEQLEHALCGQLNAVGKFLQNDDLSQQQRRARLEQLWATIQDVLTTL